MGGYWSTLNGVLIFGLNQLPDLPAGLYTLGMEYAHQFAYEVPSVGSVYDVPSVGHTITVAITESEYGKRISVPLSNKKYK